MFRYRDVCTAMLCLVVFVGQGLAQSANEPRLYFFTQESCPPCALQKPEIQRLVEAGYPVQEIDVRSQPEWSARFQIHRTPTLVLVWNNREVQRQESGRQPVSAEQMVGWFQQLSAAAVSRNAVPQSPRQVPAQQVSSNNSNSHAPDPASTTVGDREPRNEVESLAMQATVRIRVTEADAFSFATGTIIHSVGNEAIVLTCGHVFRDSNGKGEITAEFGWIPGETVHSARGQLLAFDAGPRDVALIQFVSEHPMPAIPVAPMQMVVSKMDEVFSIGCDHGQPPTIRRTRIKDLSNYDGVDKYDIYGRPVEGRSGGGLFSAGGQLLGVCNAAAVDFDEGIYSSLPNIWGEFARTGLDRVLTGPTPEFAIAGNRPQGQAGTFQPAVAGEASNFKNWTTPPMTTVSNDIPQGFGSGEMELIAVIRNRETGQANTIVIGDPDSELLDYLLANKKDGRESDSSALDRMAELRSTMPAVVNPDRQNRGMTIRSQSPDSRQVR